MISLSLGPAGQLIMHLPHEDEGETQVALKPGREVEMITRVLQSQLNGTKRHTGTDSAPTQHLIDHLSSHDVFPSDKCPFCIAEAGAGDQQELTRRRQHVVKELARHGGVVIRRLQNKSRKISQHAPTLEELGL